MRSVPERPVFLSFVVLIGCLVAGPLLGFRLGESFAPESHLAQVASVLAFPLAFFAGLLFWLGLGVITVILGGLLNLLGGRIPSTVDLDSSEALVPPGYGSFVAFSVLVSGAAGLFVWLLSDASLMSTLSAYGASGTMYGLSLSLLAHHGYLPFPEPA